MSYYYHSTNLKGLEGIMLNKMQIECDYFDEKGFFVSENIEHSKIFGYVTIHIPKEKIDPNNLVNDGVNDGLFHIGALDIKDCLVTFENCDRYKLDHFNYIYKLGFTQKDFLQKEIGAIHKAPLTPIQL